MISSERDLLISDHKLVQFLFLFAKVKVIIWLKFMVCFVTIQKGRFISSKKNLMEEINLTFRKQESKGWFIPVCFKLNSYLEHVLVVRTEEKIIK